VLCISLSDGSSTKPCSGLTVNNVPSNAFIFICISSLGIVTWKQTDSRIGQLKQCFTFGSYLPIYRHGGTQVHSQCSTCAIHGEQNGTVGGFPQRFSCILPASYLYIISVWHSSCIETEVPRDSSLSHCCAGHLYTLGGSSRKHVTCERDFWLLPRSR
jgi:hypothetical protein